MGSGQGHTGGRAKGTHSDRLHTTPFHTHGEHQCFFYRIEQSTNQKEQILTFIVLVTSHVYACAGPRLNSVGRLHEKTMT